MQVQVEFDPHRMDHAAKNRPNGIGLNAGLFLLSFCPKIGKPPNSTIFWASHPLCPKNHKMSSVQCPKNCEKQVVKNYPQNPSSGRSTRAIRKKFESKMFLKLNFIEFKATFFEFSFIPILVSFGPENGHPPFPEGILDKQTPLPEISDGKREGGRKKVKRYG